MRPELVIAALPAFGAGIQAGMKTIRARSAEFSFSGIADGLSAHALLLGSLIAGAYACRQGLLSELAFFGGLSGLLLGFTTGALLAVALVHLDRSSGGIQSDIRSSLHAVQLPTTKE